MVERVPCLMRAWVLVYSIEKKVQILNARSLGGKKILRFSCKSLIGSALENSTVKEKIIHDTC